MAQPDTGSPDSTRPAAPAARPLSNTERRAQSVARLRDLLARQREAQS